MIEITNEKEKLKEFQLLLEGPEKEFIDFGKLIAPKSKIIQRENDLGELIIQEGLANKNNTTVLSKKELLQELCKYNLAILPIYSYKGDFSIDYLKNVKEFLVEKKLSVSDYDLKNKLYAIYPKVNFRHLKDNEVTSNYMYNGNRETNPTILFEEEGFYHLVHKGKNYKNLYNLRRGLLFYSDLSNVMVRLFSVILLAIILYLIPFKAVDIKLIFFIIYFTYNCIYTFYESDKSKQQFNDEMYNLC